jgi:2-polyprenyl-3-methyl-5-hydroxy-6-metoxy-1,4-benzoquinol methylase
MRVVTKRPKGGGLTRPREPEQLVLAGGRVGWAEQRRDLEAAGPPGLQARKGRPGAIVQGPFDVARDDGVPFGHARMESHRTAPSDRLRDVYERRAELQYPAPAPLPDPSLDRKFERVCELVAEQLPRGRYLDAGCGDGRYLAALARLPTRPARIVATDISGQILDVAHAAAAEAGVEVETIRANLEALPLDDESFDLVLCTQVIEHLLDARLGLAEIARVLAPDGCAIVTTDHGRSPVTKALNLPRTVAVRMLGLRGRRIPVVWPERTFLVDELAGLIRDAGLQVERTETFRFTLLPPLDWKPAVRTLNRLDRRLAPHGLGNLIAVIARKPA